MARRAAAIAIVAGVALWVAAPATARAGMLVQDVSITHDGLTRYFDYYVPDGLPSAPVPLLFVLHGGTQSNDFLQVGASAEFRSLADGDGFLVIYPNGTSSETGLSGPSGSFNWNDCRADAGDATTTADDVGLVSALIDWAATSFNVDLERVYATGSSNGGLMSYRLAFELSDRIAAVGAVIANLPTNSECTPQPASPVAVLIMNGTADAFMPFAGGQILGNRGLVLSAYETRDFWRSFLATGATPTHIDVPDLNTADQSDAEVDLYCSGVEGSGVAFVALNGGGHTLPSIAHPIGPAFAGLGPQNRDLEGPAEIWRFLARQRRGGTPGGCGNGCIDAGELCDDGNTLDGDCCSSTCGSALACPACEWCDPRVGACAIAPLAGCRSSTAPAKSALALRNDPADAGDRVTWKWLKGEATSLGDLGNPETTDGYALCLYDDSQAAAGLLFRATAPADGTCDTIPCWTALGGGFRYRDEEGTPDGLASVLLRAGAAGAARAIVKGRNGNLSGRPAGLPSLPLALPLRAQLQAENGACFTTIFSTTGVLQNDGRRFRASGR